MNHNQHRDITLCAAHALGITGQRLDLLVENSAVPDSLGDVRVGTLGSDPDDEIFGLSLSALCHFQHADGGGYRWGLDPSLSALEDGIATVGMALAQMRVSGASGPMLDAWHDQPETLLCDFRFPSASVMARYLAAWPGRELHPVQDMVIPHHVQGMLRGGHQDFEDDLEDRWFEHRRMIAQSSDPKVGAKLFLDLARSWRFHATCIEDLVTEVAEQTRVQFPPGDLTECSPILAIDLCSRAVGGTMHAIKLMKGNE